MRQCGPGARQGFDRAHRRTPGQAREARGPGSYDGHSLRAGLVTEVSAIGAADREIMKETGYESIAFLTEDLRRGGAYPSGLLSIYSGGSGVG